MIAKTLSQMAANQTFILTMACIGLIIFLTFFIGMLIWTAQRKNQVLYQSMSQMPIEDDHSEYLKIEVKI